MCRALCPLSSSLSLEEEGYGALDDKGAGVLVNVTCHCEAALWKRIAHMLLALQAEMDFIPTQFSNILRSSPTSEH